MQSTKMKKKLQKQSSTQPSGSIQHPTINAHVTYLGKRVHASSSNESKEVTWNDVAHVKILIEACLQLHMNRDETVNALLTNAKIEPEFTTLVWQALEKDNPGFFKAYHLSQELEKQVQVFNHLLMKMCNPVQNQFHSMPANNLPMTYPMLQQPSNAEANQPHLDSSSHVDFGDFGVPEPNNFHPIPTNSRNNMMMDDNAPNMAHVIEPNGAMPVNPTSMASSDYFSFPAEVDTNASALDMPFKSNAASSSEPRFASNNGAGNSSPLEQNQWNSSLDDLTDIFNFGGDDFFDNFELKNL